MRLVLVTNDYPPKPGGIQQYLGNLVRHLDADVLVVAPADERAGVDEPNVVRSHRRFMWPTPAVARSIAEHVSEFAAHAVVFGAPHPLALLGRRLRRELGVPFAVISHGAEVTLPAAAPGLRQWLAATLRSADVRFAVSEHTARRVRRLCGRPVTVIGAGVDSTVFTPRAHPEVHRPPVVGCVSRFVPRKGQQLLIEAVAKLGRPVDLLLVGRGRMEVALRRQAADLGVRARFEVDVPWDRLPELYREMDVFCMPCRSRWGGLESEGLGLVFLEAAASGLPVLAGDSGGAPETVVPGVTGFVVHGVADIVEGLELLLEDEAARIAVGRAARERAVDEFDWPKVADRVRDGIAEVL